jgi:tripartite-type tricarboxylate transporter receptor subunit TctC
MICKTMKRSVYVRSAFTGALALTAFAAVPAAADPVKDFYKQATITQYVGSGAGGGFDVYIRMLARHMAGHIPGHPQIITKNMPGASGMKAINYVYNVAPRDGSVLSITLNGAFMLPLYGEKKARFDALKFGWVGSIGKQTGICGVWHTQKINSLADAEKQTVMVGATGALSKPALYPKMLNDMFGAKFKVITGYSTDGVKLALERGEIQGICGMSYETLKAASSEWLRAKKYRVLLQMGLKPNPDMKGVPMALDMIKDPIDRKVFELVMIPQEFGRPIITTPGVPKARLEALRTAFMATMKDKAYVADANKSLQFIDPMSGPEIVDLLKQAYASPKNVVKLAAKYANPPRKKKKKSKKK